jgi:hypothetical protein
MARPLQQHQQPMARLLQQQQQQPMAPHLELISQSSIFCSGQCLTSERAIMTIRQLIHTGTFSLPNVFYFIFDLVFYL